VAGRRAARAGFTLIEMLAVVAIFALLAAFLVPGLGSLTGQDLDESAERMAARIELARQRAVATGVPHRLALDLEGAAWRLEWLAPDPELEAAAEAAGIPLEPDPFAPVDLRGPIPMAPPLTVEREFRPVPGSLGDVTHLTGSVLFHGVETPEGVVVRGIVDVPFRTDGTAPYTAIHLVDEDGRGLALEVLPLSDAVRIYDVEV